MGLDSVELVWGVEAAFGVELPEPEMAAVRTVGDLHAAVMRAVGVTPGTPAAAEAWARLVETIVESTGVPTSRVTPAARIVADLGIN